MKVPGDFAALLMVWWDRERNGNGRAAVLDAEHWMIDVEVNLEVKRQVLHSHYSKPKANTFVTHRKSTVASNGRRYDTLC